MMNKLITHGFVAMVVWCNLVSVAQGNESKNIQFRTIGVAPYGILDHATSSGIYYDLANLIAEQAGYHVNNAIYPYARIIEELKVGLTDVTIMFKYNELEGHVSYLAPLDTLKIVVLGLKGTNFDSLDALKGKTLAYLRGAKFSDTIDADPDIFRYDVTDFAQGIRMLMLDRVHGVIGPLDPLLFSYLKMGNTTNIFDQPLLVGEKTPWLQVSKKSLNRISEEKLKSAFKDIKQKGELKALRLKYLTEINEFIPREK